MSTAFRRMTYVVQRKDKGPFRISSDHAVPPVYSSACRSMEEARMLVEHLPNNDPRDYTCTLVQVKL